MKLGTWKDAVRGIISGIFGFALADLIIVLTHAYNLYLFVGMGLALGITIACRSYDWFPDKKEKK